MSQKKSNPLRASIHPGAPTPENVMDFTLSSIRDPQNPAHCGQCLYGALFVLTITAPDPLPGTEAAFKLPAPLRKNTPFWNSLLAFLVMPRSDEEVERLLKKFAICKCDLRDRLVREYHAAGKAKEEDMMKRMCLELWAPKEEKKKYTTARCAVVVKIIQTLDSALTEGHVRSVAKGLTEAWPTAPTDLIPCGADELVESLLRWYRFVPDPLVFHLAAHILHTCRFLLVPSFVKYRLSAVMFDSFYDSFKQISEQLNKLPAVISITNPEGITMGVSTMVRYHTLVSTVIEYLNEVLKMPEDCIPDILVDCETKAIQLCSVIIYLANSPRMGAYALPRETWTRIQWYGYEVFRLFSAHLQSRPDTPLHPAIVDIDDHKSKSKSKSASMPRPSHQSTARAVMACIASLHAENRCSAYKCPNSIQSAGKSFARCAGCGTVPYCGRECQKAAWREERYPHKRVCPAIRSLVDAAGGPGFFWSVSEPPEVVKGFLKGKDEEPWVLCEGYIRERWQEAGIEEDNENVGYVLAWAKYVDGGRGSGTEGTKSWSPGFDDYEAFIGKLSAGGPHPRYISRV